MGIGKTRSLAELAMLTSGRGFTTLWGRAAEFEQVMPFSALIDALDDHLESNHAALSGRFSPAQRRLLATVFPALASSEDTGPETPDDRSGLVRLRLYRAVRQLVDELAAPAGLALILDDVHWTDPSTAEFLDHLVRHPPRGRVLVAVTYRPAQASPRVAALVHTVGGHEVTVGPLGPAEVAELLGAEIYRTRGRVLYEASGGNPFYLQALARMDRLAVSELPGSVRAALLVELGALPPGPLRIAQAAAVAADEVEPALAAVAAEMTEDATLAALNDLVARDVLRPATAGRFRFRHPLVRQAAYEYAEAGWRLGAHARLAAHLAGAGAPATMRAHHVELSGTFGDRHAATTLVTAARTVAAQAPETCAHWLGKALELMPVRPRTLAERLELLMELGWALGVSGRLAESRDAARELLRALPVDQHSHRARAARMGALMERQLGRPDQARALLLDELNRMPDPRMAAAIPLRLRLVAESLMRMDFRAAQAVLDLMPDSDDGWPPGLAVAVAALRPMAAYAAGRMADAVRTAEAAERVFDATPDGHLAEWLDTVAWLCWAEGSLGRYPIALRLFDRAADIARSTGRIHMVTNLLAGKARTLVALGRLPEALDTVEESIDIARLLGSGHQLTLALTEMCFVLAWSGDHDAALRVGAEAVATADGREVWAFWARTARGVAMVTAGRPADGVDALLAARAEFDSRTDLATVLSTYELLAEIESERSNTAEATRWAELAAGLDDPDLPVFGGVVALARAHATRAADPTAAAAHAEKAAVRLRSCHRRIDAGRALFTAGLAHAAAGHVELARERLREATELFAGCGARALEGKAIRERRRLRERVPSPSTPGQSGGPHGLTPRELEIALLVAQGRTNQKIAEQLFISVRTVETHLSRVFTKLDVTSRAGVAATMARDT